MKTNLLTICNCSDCDGLWVKNKQASSLAKLKEVYSSEMLPSVYPEKRGNLQKATFSKEDNQ